MPTYDRSAPTDPEIIDRFESGFGWFAHPGETGRRASHAVQGDDGVWLLDPRDVPGLDDRLAALDDLAGVAVLSGYHARDAHTLAERHDVPVFVPRWLDRAAERIPGSVERCAWSLGESGFALQRYTPFPGWSEAIAYRESNGTLYVPDSFGTGPLFTVGSERLGLFVLCRFVPPRRLLTDLEPERILVGHGRGVFEDPAVALSDALDGARRRLPRALCTSGNGQLRAALGALRY